VARAQVCTGITTGTTSRAAADDQAAGAEQGDEAHLRIMIAHT
jgi:hypothetical protein